MFIRWVKRGHKNQEAANLTFHDAYLVESYRNDEGNPRQRNIAYLGNVRQINDTLPGVERELFLFRAENILKTIHKISPADRTSLMQQLHRHVPPLSTDEAIDGFRNTVSWYIRWWDKRSDAPTKEELRYLIESVINDPYSIEDSF